MTIFESSFYIYSKSVCGNYESPLQILDEVLEFMIEKNDVWGIFPYEYFHNFFS